MISVIRDAIGFEALQERWDELFELSSTATPYQTFLFNKITWEVWHKPDDRLYIICYSQSEGAKYEAIIPCYMNGKGVLHLIDYMSDFCDGIFNDVYLENYSMYREICNCILDDNDIKCAYFNNLQADSRMLAYLYAFGGNSSAKTLTGYSIIRMVPSEKDNDCFNSIKNCNRHQRSKLRNQFKNISNRIFHEYSMPDAFPQSEIETVADFMINTRIRDKEYFDKRFFDYVQRLYSVGLLSIYTHINESYPVAENILLTNTKTNEHILWITLYRNKNDNSNLVLATLDKMYRDSIYNLNFARGIYAYKLSNFHPEIYTLNQLRIYKNRHEAIKANLSEAINNEFKYLKQKAYITLSGIKHKIFG